MRTTEFEISLLLFFVAIAIDLIFGPSKKAFRAIPHVLAIIGSLLNVVVAIGVLVKGGIIINMGSFFGVGETVLKIDDLAALFLLWLFGLAAIISIFTLIWILNPQSPRRKGLACGYILLFAAVAVVISAGDVFTFIFAWESLTLSFYILTSVTRQTKSQAGDAWLTLGVQKIGGACLLVGFLLLAGKSGSLTFSNWTLIQSGFIHDAAYGLIIAGFAAKLGIAPLQGWMPSGYSVAPGPTRAAMAGIAANAAVYGLFRFFGILGKPPVWLVIGVLLLGSLTAVLGIIFAGVERRLSKLVAFSSVENAGIIFTAFGVALAGEASGDTVLIAVGLLATAMHSIAHSIGKSTLFTSITKLEQVSDSEYLDDMRGIGKKLPYSSISFTLGALSLAGLPPTIGFVSEWLVLESLMQEFRVSSLAIRLALLLAGALIALTSGLAALAFIRVIGLVLLGKSKSAFVCRREKLVPNGTGLMLGGLCLAISAVTPLEIRLISRGLSSLGSLSTIEGALHSPFVIQPVFPNFSILSPSWLIVVMPIFFIAVVILAWLASGRSYFKVRRVPPWHSATIGVDGESSYTSFGFSNLLRHILANVLGTVREIEHDSGNGNSPKIQSIYEIRYHTKVTEPVQAYIYRPAVSATLALSALARRLQSGKLQAYVGYMFLTLIAALLFVAIRG